LSVPLLEQELGIRIYGTQASGFDGLIKQRPEDFVVQEILIDGAKAELHPMPPQAINGQGRFLICILTKQNIDTIHSIRVISQRLGISERRIQIAGMKDKKALTAQHISIENIKPEKLRRIQECDIRVVPLYYSPSMVFPHMSFGNNFSIIVRGIPHSQASIQNRVEKVSEELQRFTGIPNFFGHQRFGTIRPITHLVGQAILENNFEKAAFLFLAKASLYEHPQSREARQQLLETRNFNEALTQFPYRLTYERRMIAHLVKYPRDYRGAFTKLPRRLTRLFLQAYQSYLFNRFLSARISAGTPANKPHIGDFLVKTDSHGLPTQNFVVTTQQNLDSYRKAVKAKKMCVALPLVGHKQIQSAGQQGELEQEILDGENVNLEDFKVPSYPKMGAKGGLRPAVVPIFDLKIRDPIEDDLNQNRKAIKLSFTLQRGCYATVILREFMKPDDLIKAGF
jgi:tRNA pseudouridine13 synthase